MHIEICIYTHTSKSLGCELWCSRRVCIILDGVSVVYMYMYVKLYTYTHTRTRIHTVLWMGMQMLQHTATYCNTVRCATHYDDTVLQHRATLWKHMSPATATHCNKVLHHTATLWQRTNCSTLQHGLQWQAAILSNTMQYPVLGRDANECCNTLQHSDTLQHTATHWHTHGYTPSCGWERCRARIFWKDSFWRCI